MKKIFRHLIWRTRHSLRVTFPQLFLSYFLPKRVMTGPFTGMKYTERSVGSVILPKLTGTYEDELYGTFEKISHKNYNSFIDVGAAEGYYAVGVKKYLLPQTKQVIAFEATQKGRDLVKKLADLNGVNGITIKGFCDTDALAAVLSPDKTFMLVDIEGGEYSLLNPDKINFSNSDLLIEMHEVNDKKRYDELVKKFSDTHYVTEIEKGNKKLPENINWPSIIKRYKNYVVNEFRGGDQSWLFLESKQAA